MSISDSKFQIISDGSCDLPQDIVEQYQLKILPFYVTFDGENYKKEIEEVGVREFYQEMVDHPKVFPKSSLPSVGDYEAVFRSYTSQNIPIICVCITTKFSGSYNSAMTAKDLILEEFPNAKITVIDSKINTVLQGLLVIEAAKMQQANKSYDEVVEYLETKKETGRILFTIANIDYLKKGGRIGKLLTVAGSSLGIKPLIELKEGEIFPFGITRSREKSKGKVLDRVKEYFTNNEIDPNNYVFAVGYGYDYEEGVTFKQELVKILETMVDKPEVPVRQIGATIGVHTGPHPIGVGLIEKGNY